MTDQYSDNKSMYVCTSYIYYFYDRTMLIISNSVAGYKAICTEE